MSGGRLFCGTGSSRRAVAEDLPGSVSTCEERRKTSAHYHGVICCAERCTSQATARSMAYWLYVLRAYFLSWPYMFSL